MRLPRFLWVPFELGRPFGAPNEPDFQRRVLRAALALLERDDGPVILEDFPDDAPVVSAADGAEGWSCPISFDPPPTDGEPELVLETLAEIERLAPWHEIYVAERGRAAPPASDMTHREVILGLGGLAADADAPEVPSNLPLQEWVRLGCEDVRTWYLEAAQGQPGRAQSSELQNWFWRKTAFARLIAGAARHFARSGDGSQQMFGRRGMVPRTYMRQLMPDVDPSLGDLPSRPRSSA
jgi:hypothetical protein